LLQALVRFWLATKKDWIGTIGLTRAEERGDGLPSVSDGPLFPTDRANKHGTDGVGTEKARVRIE